MSNLPEVFQVKPVWRRNLYWKRQGYNEALQETRAVELYQTLQNVKKFCEHWNIKLDESVGVEAILAQFKGAKSMKDALPPNVLIHYAMRPVNEIPADYKVEAKKVYDELTKDYNCMGMADMIGCLIECHESRLNGDE